MHPISPSIRGGKACRDRKRIGVIAPAGTPAAVVSSLNAAFNAVVKVSGVTRKLEQGGNVPNLNLTPEEYSAFIRSELDKWRPIVRKLAIKPG